MGSRLGERDAKAARWEGKDRKVDFGDGLYLQVRKSSKIWFHRDRRAGERFVKIGAYPDKSVKAARAAALSKALEDAPDHMSVERLAERYGDEVAAGNLKNIEPLQGYINRGTIPLSGDARVAAIQPAKLAAGVRRYSGDHGSRTGDILRNHLRAMFSYAVELGIRHDNPMVNISRRL